MRFSVRTDYAIRALLEVTARDPELVKVSDIVALQHLPPDYLASLLGRLAHAGLVISRRGPNGGFVLARSSESITLSDIVDAVDRAPHEWAPPRITPDSSSVVAVHLEALWDALAAHNRLIMDGITLRQILEGDFSIEGSRRRVEPHRAHRNGSR